MSKSSVEPKRILLGHLASKGDCLYATSVARQIKEDEPKCRLTWCIGSFARDVIEGNPYVDEIWEYPVPSRHEMDIAWKRFEHEARRRKRRGDFDEVVLTQVSPGNYQNFDGTVRSSIFRGYPRRMTVPVQPVIRLSEGEVKNVAALAAEWKLTSFRHVILFESASASGQSFVTPGFALSAARRIVERVPECGVILSSNIRCESGDPRIIDGSVLKYRENAEITKYCTLVVGCSSGISWLCTSDWAKPLPIIQLLKKSTGVFASMLHDAEYFGLPTAHILEMTDCSEEHLAACVAAACCRDFAAARDQYHERIPVNLDLYFDLFMKTQLRNRHPLKVLKSLSRVYGRYGPGPIKDYVARKLSIGVAR